MSESSLPSVSTDAAARPRHTRRAVMWVIVGTLVAAFLIMMAVRRGGAGAQGGDNHNEHGAAMTVSVAAAPVRIASVPIWVTALGTVTPHSYVNVMPRVAGLLQRIHYREGQMVKAGQLLAEIDPRPFQIAVEQAQGQLLRDQAQLDGARRNLKRFATLLAQDSIATQQVDDQRALVAQYSAALAADRAALAASKLQFSYTRILAPVSGLTGLRPVDPGNMVGTGGVIGNTTATATGTAGSGVNSGGSNATPIVSLAQVQPVNVSFAIAQAQIGSLVQRLQGGESLPVEAWNANNSVRLAVGRLLAADNQINVATGTLNLKAEFQNTALTLYPNQFVNVRLRVATLKDARVIPSVAVANGAPGSYVYLIGADHKVSVRPVTIAATVDNLAVVSAGLQAGDQVVTDGLDRLHAGATVRVTPAQEKNHAASQSADRHPEAGAAGDGHAR